VFLSAPEKKEPEQKIDGKQNPPPTPLSSSASQKSVFAPNHSFETSPTGDKKAEDKPVTGGFSFGSATSASSIFGSQPKSSTVSPIVGSPAKNATPKTPESSSVGLSIVGSVKKPPPVPLSYKPVTFSNEKDQVLVCNIMQSAPNMTLPQIRASSSNSSLFGQPAPAQTTTGTSLFGGQPAPAQTTTGTSLFGGQPAQPTAGASLFGTQPAPSFSTSPLDLPSLPSPEAVIQICRDEIAQQVSGLRDSPATYIKFCVIPKINSFADELEQLENISRVLKQVPEARNISVPSSRENFMFEVSFALEQLFTLTRNPLAIGRTKQHVFALIGAYAGVLSLYAVDSKGLSL